MFYTEDDRRPGLPLQLLTRPASEGRVEHTGWRVRKDGTRFWGDVVITALHDEAGELTGFAKVTRDLTEQHAARGRAAHQRGAAAPAGRPGRRLRDHRAGPPGHHRDLEPRRRAGQGLHRRGGHRAQLRDVLHRGGPRAGLPLHLLAEARERGRVEHTGWRVRKDGTRFWGDVVITAMHDSAGQLTGYAKVTRDRTDVKALEDAQDAFYAAFNHDFRTPITAIKGFIDAMRDAEDDERGRC